MFKFGNMDPISSMNAANGIYTPPTLGRNRAMALVSGKGEFSGIEGSVTFVQKKNGVLVTANINGLPQNGGECGGGIFGFHIHEGGSCTGTEKDPYADAKSHYNPRGCPHPFHAGDLPPLFASNGYAYLSVLTNRFNLDEIIGKTVIIHDMPDDFTTQPSGNSGSKIACGIIMR